MYNLLSDAMLLQLATQDTPLNRWWRVKSCIQNVYGEQARYLLILPGDRELPLYYHVLDQLVHPCLPDITLPWFHYWSQKNAVAQPIEEDLEDEIAVAMTCRVYSTLTDTNFLCTWDMDQHIYEDNGFISLQVHDLLIPPEGDSPEFFTCKKGLYIPLGVLDVLQVTQQYYSYSRGKNLLRTYLPNSMEHLPVLCEL